MTSPGGIPNLPPNAFSASAIGTQLQGITSEKMRQRAGAHSRQSSPRRPAAMRLTLPSRLASSLRYLDRSCRRWPTPTPS